MPDPDYKTLCAELVESLENARRIIQGADGTLHINTAEFVLRRARTALAQPEPVTPTDEELDDLFVSIDEGASALNWRTYARAVLAKWGTPANNTREENFHA